VLVFDSLHQFGYPVEVGLPVLWDTVELFDLDSYDARLHLLPIHDDSDYGFHDHLGSQKLGGVFHGARLTLLADRVEAATLPNLRRPR